MTNEEKQELFDALTGWHSSIVKQLKLITEQPLEQKIIIQGSDDEKFELVGDRKALVQTGVQVALDMIEEFPLKISKR